MKKNFVWVYLGLKLGDLVLSYQAGHNFFIWFTSALDTHSASLSRIYLWFWNKAGEIDWLV